MGVPDPQWGPEGWFRRHSADWLRSMTAPREDLPRAGSTSIDGVFGLRGAGDTTRWRQHVA